MRINIIHPFDFQVTVVGTRVLQGVRAVDADQPGPYSTVQYAVLPGPHSVNSTIVLCLLTRILLSIDLVTYRQSLYNRNTSCL